MEKQPVDLEPIERGDVYRLSFRGTGRELMGPHYAVVVSDAPFNELSTVVVIPFSSHAAAATFRPEAIIEGRLARALPEQIAAVDKRRLRDRITSLTGTAAMELIDEQLRLLLGLDLPEAYWG